MPFPKGLAYRIALIPAFLAFAAPIAAQTTWTKQPLRIRSDDTWGDIWAKAGSRMFVDTNLNLFVNLEDSLCVGARNGASWRPIPRMFPKPAFGSSPLAVGVDGTVLWDRRSTRDQGKSWKPLNDSGMAGWATAFGVAGNGSFLTGGSYDHLNLSVNAGQDWDRVHFGKTFGNITAIAGGDARDNWVFAAPAADELLASRDFGKTWAPATDFAKGRKPDRLVARYIACNPKQNILMALTDPNTSDPVIEEIRWIDDSLTIESHQATRTFPDSGVSAFAIFSGEANGAVMWVGTWGQGVHVSSDWGKSWSPRNAGLSDLHVEALAVARDGTAHALTKDGLYTMTASTSLRPAPAPRSGRATPRGERAGHVWFGNGSEVSNPVDLVFRADGRAHRLPSTALRQVVGAP